MKLLFFSDIHGVASALEKLLKEAERLQPDRLILLGDALYHGPRNGVPAGYDPTKVVEMLNAHCNDIVAVRGNCDCEVDQMLLKFPVLGDFAEILTPEMRIFATHGHLWNADKLPPLPAGTHLFHGHTHLTRTVETPQGITVHNVGSISLPKDDFGPAFGWLDGNNFEFKKLQ